MTVKSKPQTINLALAAKLTAITWCESLKPVNYRTEIYRPLKHIAV